MPLTRLTARKVFLPKSYSRGAVVSADLGSRPRRPTSVLCLPPGPWTDSRCGRFLALWPWRRPFALATSQRPGGRRFVMLSMSVPLGQAASAAHEANRAPAAELLQSAREMKQELHVFSRERSAKKDRPLSSTVRSAYGGSPHELCRAGSKVASNPEELRTLLLPSLAQIRRPAWPSLKASSFSRSPWIISVQATNPVFSSSFPRS